MTNPIIQHLAIGILIVGVVLATSALEQREYVSALLTLGVAGVMSLAVMAIGRALAVLTRL